MATPIKVNEAKAALAILLNAAGVRDVVQQYLLLEEYTAGLWFQMLQNCKLDSGLDVWDVISGKTALIEQLIPQFPRKVGETDRALVARTIAGLERIALLEAQP